MKLSRFNREVMQELRAQSFENIRFEQRSKHLQLHAVAPNGRDVVATLSRGSSPNSPRRLNNLLSQINKQVKG